jgi:hypothetical protein
MPLPSSGPGYTIEGGAEIERYAETLNKFFRTEMQEILIPYLDEGAELVKAGIRPNLPHHTGKLESALGSRTVRSGLYSYAEIGFGKRYGMPSAPYAAALNQGTVAHTETARRTEDGLLHFSSKGRFTSIGTIQQPGFGGLHFAEAGLEAATPGLDALFGTAVDEVIEKMAIS